MLFAKASTPWIYLGTIYHIHITPRFSIQSFTNYWFSLRVAFFDAYKHTHTLCSSTTTPGKLFRDYYAESILRYGCVCAHSTTAAAHPFFHSFLATFFRFSNFLNHFRMLQWMSWSRRKKVSMRMTLLPQAWVISTPIRIKRKLYRVYELSEFWLSLFSPYTFKFWQVCCWVFSKCTK